MGRDITSPHMEDGMLVIRMTGQARVVFRILQLAAKSWGNKSLKDIIAEFK